MPNYDNVFLSNEGVEPGMRRLIAMDHGLCFIRSGGEITDKISSIGKVKEAYVYGLFPEFRGRLRHDTMTECTERLQEMERETAKAIVASIPGQWDVSSQARDALCELIYCRSGFVAENIESWLQKVVMWHRPQGE